MTGAQWQVEGGLHQGGLPGGHFAALRDRLAPFWKPVTAAVWSMGCHVYRPQA